MSAEAAAESVVDFAASCEDDPAGWVIGAYPWGADELEDKTPHRWQLQVLDHIGDQLKASKGQKHRVIRVAVASGHGIGKSTLCAWLVDWAMSTHAFTRCVVTANTEQQLKQKTWGEMAKWRRLSLTKDWFRISALSLFSPAANETQNWRADLVPWSEVKPEAFAGLHNMKHRILLIFDEASAIPRIIWETAEGALTDEETEIIWCVFGNPTRNSGRFAECFKAMKERWYNLHIDSRKIPGINLKQIQEWIDDYGEDSDFVRVRVKGQFPRAGSMQFIPEEWVTDAQERHPASTREDPLIVGIDVARSGDNRSVIYTRCGRDGKTFRPQIFPDTSDTMRFATWIAQHLNDIKPDACFVDGGGVGGPVVDRIRQLGHPVIEVQFGSKADNDERYYNKRAEMWGRMRDWLQVGSIWDHYSLFGELTALEASTDLKDRVKLERKEDLIKRGEASPDVADALALTFAYPVTSVRASSLAAVGAPAKYASNEYDMYGDEEG